MSAAATATAVLGFAGPVLAHATGIGADELAIAAPVPLVVLAVLVFSAKPPGRGGGEDGYRDDHDDDPPPGLDEYDADVPAPPGAGDAGEDHITMTRRQ